MHILASIIITLKIGLCDPTCKIFSYFKLNKITKSDFFTGHESFSSKTCFCTKKVPSPTA